MNFTRCLSCLLLVMTLCHGGIHRVQGEAIGSEVPQMSTEVSAESNPTDVENTKQPLRKVVLKRFKLFKTKAKVPKLPKVRVAKVGKLGKVAKVARGVLKPRFWAPKLKTIASTGAGIAGTVIGAQAVAHFYNRFGFGQSPEEMQAQQTTNDTDVGQVELAPMYYSQLAPFMISPAYGHIPAMPYQYLPPLQAGYANPGYSNPLYQESYRSYQNPISHQGYQNQGLQTPAFENQMVQEIAEDHSQPEVPPQPEETEKDSPEETNTTS